MRNWTRWTMLAALLAGSVGVGGGLARATGSPATPASGTRIYWDQNEEQDLLVDPNAWTGAQLVPPWNPNGQMCLHPNGSGTFTTGYNPTTDPGNAGFSKPTMLPPIGQAVWGRDGHFTGKTIAVPGPYAGGDIPPVPGSNPPDYNSDGTYTGCVFDSHANLFGADIGTAQGAVPPPDDGRLIEWFAPAYSTYCIIAGPTSSDPNAPQSDNPHHVDGHGGLRQPGIMARDAHDDILVPVVGAGTGPPHGAVLQFPRAALPTSAAQCPGPSNMAAHPVQPVVLIDAAAHGQPTPQGIARDPVCGCWAVTNVFDSFTGTPAVAWYDDRGQPRLDRAPVPAGDYNPFGLAFTRGGTLYVADMHVACDAGGCGPANGQGRMLKIAFTTTPTGQVVPGQPVAVATGLSFPVGVTACEPAAHRLCPAPRP